jgi:transposase
VFATGQGRKTDATDVRCVALVGTRMTGLRPLVNDEQLAVLRILVDRRRCLGEDDTRMVSRLHQLLLELIPGGAKKSLSAAQAKTLLATVKPRDVVGKACRRVAAELIADLRAGRSTVQAGRQRAHRTGRRHRHHADGPARHRALRRGTAAGGSRRRHPLPQPGGRT